MKNHIKTKYELWRQGMYITIFGSNTFKGKLFDIVLLLVILLSVALLALESVESISKKYHNYFIVCEWGITAFFTIEYLLRILLHKKPKSYIFSFYGLIDLISFLPMYISLFYPPSLFLMGLRSVRLLRLFSILDMMPIIGQQSHLKVALQASKNKIIVFTYFIIVMSIALGTVMYIVESGKGSGFTDIPTSIYWCIVTITTVGYGDVAPITFIGKAITSFIMILGYGIIAVPTGIITAEYNHAKHNPELDENKIICPRCTSFTYNKSANYCQNCGEKLIHENK